MICDTAEDIGEPSLWIDVVECGRLNQDEGNGNGFASTLRTDEHPIFSSKGYWLYCALASVDIQFQKAIVVIGPCLWHPAQRNTDGFCQRRLAGDFGQFRMKPCLQIIKNRFGMSLAQGGSCAPFPAPDALDKVHGVREAQGKSDKS